MQQRHIAGIDLFRFIAAFLVMSFHLDFLYLTQADAFSLATLHLQNLYMPAFGVFQYGWIGVQIFFVISGYVIAFSIEGRSRSDYARARFLRLWPTVWICASLCALLAALTHQMALPELGERWLRSMLIAPVGPWIDGVYWTLPVEIAFYALVLAFVVGRPVLWRMRLAFALGSVSALFWAMFALAAAVPTLQPFEHALRHFANSYKADILLVHHGIYFALGMMIRQPPRLKIALPFGFAMIAASLVEIPAQATTIPTAAGPACDLWLFFLGGMIMAVRYNDAITQALGANGTRILRGLGAMTYPLYLLHVVVAYAAAAFYIRLGLPQSGAWGLAVVTAILTAAIVAKWMEPQIRAKIARLIG